MTQEQTSAVVKGGLLVAMFAAIVTGAWISSTQDNRRKPPTVPIEKAPITPEVPPDLPPAIIHHQIDNDSESQRLGSILKSIVSPDNGLAIVHFHRPGDPASDQLVDILDFIRKKHGRRVLVVRIGFKGHPVGLTAQGVTKLPHIMMIVGTKKVFEFQGLWSQQRVDQKVTEILHGLLKRVGKDWRPAVPGMTPAGK